MTNVWAYWLTEIAARDKGFTPSIDEPGIQSRDTEQPVDGFWRVMGARTKWDTPIAIWRQPGAEHIVVQFGRKQPETIAEDSDRMLEFRSMSFLKCSAVRKVEWEQALSTGYWPDGKPAWAMSEDQKLDIIPSTPASEGGNIDEAEALFAQISDKIQSLIDKAGEVGRIDSLDKANAAAAIVEPLRALGKKGEAMRKEEKRPFDEGAAAVQAKWLPVLEPASATIKRLVDAIDAFRRAEEARLRREAEEKARAERERIRREEEERLRAEAETRAAEQGEPAPSDDEIAAQAAQSAAEADVPVEVEAPRVGTAYGRAIARKAAVRRGSITDVDAFIGAIKDQPDFKDWLQDKANKLARAKMQVAGMEIIEE